MENVTISVVTGKSGKVGNIFFSSEIIDLKSDSEFVQSQTDQSNQETDQMEDLEKWTWDFVCRSDSRNIFFRKF